MRIRTACLLALTSICASLAPAAVLYVDAGNANPEPPFISWPAAATNIQDAVDAANSGDTILVTNGLYNAGGRVIYGSLTNRLVVNKPLTLLSVNGAAVTIIEGNPTLGSSAVRCAYLTNDPVLIGFTFTRGGTRSGPTNEASGGGIFCDSTNCLLLDCVISSCAATMDGGGMYGGGASNCSFANNSANRGGGGAYKCALTNCSLVGNGALNNINGGGGGGASVSTLYNCFISGNRSPTRSGGGANLCTLYNCLITSNTSLVIGSATSGGTLVNCTVVGHTGIAVSSNVRNSIMYYNSTNYGAATLAYCCTTPLFLGNSLGCFTNEPLFVALAEGDFHLSPGSPCINAGYNGRNGTLAITPTDLDGNPRVVAGTVDLGAYEYQNPASQLSYAWAQNNGIGTDGTGDFADTDGDGMNNWQEWIAGTDPHDPSSALRMSAPSLSPNLQSAALSWSSVDGITYYLQRSSDPAQLTFSTIQTDIPAQPGTNLTSFVDTNLAPAASYFYRIGVQQ